MVRPPRRRPTADSAARSGYFNSRASFVPADPQCTRSCGLITTLAFEHCARVTALDFFELEVGGQADLAVVGEHPEGARTFHVSSRSGSDTQRTLHPAIAVMRPRR
jgi:hypothetical protein